MLIEGMKPLTERLETDDSESWPDKDLKTLHDAGKRWASAALDTYTGENLQAALKVSAAIAEFTAQLNVSSD